MCKNPITNHSNIMQFWDHAKNIVDPSTISIGSHIRIHLKCDKEHEWYPVAKDFASGTRRCPYCGGRKITKENNLLTKYPELAKQFDLVKNNGVTPDQVHPCSHTKYWWLCEKDHSWKASVDQRLNNGCPYCSGNKPSKENNLGAADPAILAEFDYDENDFKPEDITLGSNKPVKWKCSKCKEKWVATAKSRVKLKSGCPRCSNRVASINNNFQDSYPELIKFWNYKLNKVAPNEITHGSNKKMHWACTCGHQWRESVAQMAHRNGCSVCKKTVVSPSYNLKTEYPDIAEEFDLETNNGKKPEDCMPSSTEVINWKCKYGHKWRRSINIRTASVSNCPKCRESLGERIIRITLDKMKCKYVKQFIFKQSGMTRLKYDFAIWINNQLKLIEFHGEQHWSEWGYGTLRPNQSLEACQARDLIKQSYCESNNIPLLIIPFWQLDNIELILEAWLSQAATA